MKRLKKISALMLALALLFSLASCGTEKPKDSEETTSTTSDERAVKTQIATAENPTGMALLKLSRDRGFGYDVKFCGSEKDALALFEKGETDMATIPLFEAARLKNEGVPLKILAVSNMIYFHIVSSDESLKSFKDLKGKTLYSAFKGEAIEVMLNHILKENGVDPDEVNWEYKDSNEEIISLIKSEKNLTMLLPEPYATKAFKESEKVKETFSIYYEWNQVTDFLPAYTCIAVKEEYANNNPDIIKEFMTFFEVASNYINLTEYAVPMLLEETGFYDTKEEAAAALEGCNVVYVELESMKTLVNSIYNLLLEQSPELIGGKLPSEDIYYLG